MHWGGKTALNSVSFYKFTNILVMMGMETNMDGHRQEQGQGQGHRWTGTATGTGTLM